ncbi:hypothetical protein Tco_1310388 [Tanacetum coccineum]
MIMGYDRWALTLSTLTMKYMEGKAKNILLKAIFQEHMRRFFGMDGCKRDLGKPSETRFKQLPSQLEAPGAEESTEDANHCFSDPFPPRHEIHGSFPKTSSSAQNVAFVSQSKSSTNKVKSGFTVIYSLFAKQSEDWDLLHEDLEQIDDVDIEEMDINWQ